MLVCPYHHRLHHRGVITITGDAVDLIVTDSSGRALSAGSLARPPNLPPPAVPPCLGPTELSNLVLLCPYHHRAHHRGVITITGPADRLVVTDGGGRALSAGSIARAPTRPPPTVPPCPGPTGERADWWWYEPFQPQPPPTTN